MEKTISPEERIKRAEEIYYKRKLGNTSIRMSSSQVKDGQEKRRFSLYKKMILQILICILIYLTFSLIKEANYIFSEDVINKTKEFLSQDINFEIIAGKTSEFFQNNRDKFGFLNNFIDDDKNSQEDNEQKNQTQEDSKKEESYNNKEQENNTENSNEAVNNGQNSSENNNAQNGDAKNDEGQRSDGQNSNATNSAGGENTSNEANTNNTDANIGIGGTKNEEQTVAVSSNNNSVAKTQMEIDAEYIRQKFSFQLPAKGTVTSRYGKRTPTEIVSENHQGIDIGVNVGTTIVAAVQGKVTLVSDKGEYGVHVKIENNDIATIYAHCSQILVKEGETVQKGQQIAISGNTGNTTGPHLHFEIRRENRTVNPELVLNF